MLRASGRHSIYWKQAHYHHKGSYSRSFVQDITSCIQFAHWINGQWAPPLHDEPTLSVASPSDDLVIGQVPCADMKRVSSAVHAASAALRHWKDMDRAPFFASLARELKNQRNELCEVEALQTGIPYSAIDIEELGKISPGAPCSSPVGVSAVISSCVSPLMDGARDVLRILSQGSTVVWKPHESVPLSALHFALICHKAGLPKGCLNVVLGRGNTGDALASHFLVLGETCVRGSHTAVQAVTKAVVGRGVDPTTHVVSETNTVFVSRAPSVELALESFRGSGYQRSRCATMEVPQKDAREFLTVLAEKVGQLRIGHALDPRTQYGPQRRSQDLVHIVDYVRNAQVLEGWGLVFGGFKVAMQTGAFMAPCVIAKAKKKDEECLALERVAQVSPRGPILHMLLT